LANRLVGGKIKKKRDEGKASLTKPKLDVDGKIYEGKDGLEEFITIKWADIDRGRWGGGQQRCPY